jgi:hypothetical protein
MYTYDGVTRMLKGHFKIADIIRIIRELIEDVATPGGIPPHMQPDQIEIILRAFAAYCNTYQKRLVP